MINPSPPGLTYGFRNDESVFLKEESTEWFDPPFKNVEVSTSSKHDSSALACWVSVVLLVGVFCFASTLVFFVVKLLELLCLRCELSLVSFLVKLLELFCDLPLTFLSAYFQSLLLATRHRVKTTFTKRLAA